MFQFRKACRLMAMYTINRFDSDITLSLPTEYNELYNHNMNTHVNHVHKWTKHESLQ